MSSFLTAALTMTVVLVAYTTGKGVGRVRGRVEAHRRAIPPLNITVELNGDPLGTVEITTVRADDMDLTYDDGTTLRYEPPPQG